MTLFAFAMQVIAGDISAKSEAVFKELTALAVSGQRMHMDQRLIGTVCAGEQCCAARRLRPCFACTPETRQELHLTLLLFICDGVPCPREGEGREESVSPTSALRPCSRQQESD